MIKKVVTMSEAGLQASPIAMLVQKASQFSSSVHIEAENRKVNAKSLMGMMTLAVRGGDVITVITEGADEEVAANEIEAYLNAQV
ncbi:MAG: HPr family phosphocarrier protein [Faecalimonas sp.]|nr:HPr family phosphocarrier protein [Faecalimonas sp.]